MASRLRETTVRRPSLPLTAADEDGLADIRQSPELLTNLRSIAGVEIDLRSATESALLQAIFRAGLNSVREAAVQSGYAELGAQMQAASTQRRETARRRQPTWVDEE